jgi:hypothetical protein
MDAKFDNANNRYVFFDSSLNLFSRANQDCKSGPVVDRTKYGNPMVKKSKPNI